MKRLVPLLALSSICLVACEKQHDAANAETSPVTETPAINQTSAPELALKPKPELSAGPAAVADLKLSEHEQRGSEVYQYWCVTCHGSGQGRPGTMALGFKYEGKVPAQLEHRNDLTADVLTYFVRNGISVMPSFRPTELSDEDIIAVAAYLKASSTAQ